MSIEIEVPVSAELFNQLWDAMMELDDVKCGEENRGGFRAIQCTHGNVIIKYVMRPE